MMYLLKENQNVKRSIWVQAVLGTALLVFGIFLLLMSSYGVQGVLVMWPSFADWPSFIILALLTGAVALLTGPKDKVELISNIRKSLLPVGFAVTLFSVMTVLLHTDFSELGAMTFIMCMEVALIPMLYAIVGYLIFWIIEERMRKKS